MARVTIEDCLKRIPNMYEIVHLATKRVRQLQAGNRPLVDCKNREPVTALREIASGQVKSSLRLNGHSGSHGLVAEENDLPN